VNVPLNNEYITRPDLLNSSISPKPPMSMTLMTYVSKSTLQITSGIGTEGHQPHQFELLNFFGQSLKFGQMLIVVSMLVQYYQINQSTQYQLLAGCLPQQPHPALSLSGLDTRPFSGTVYKPRNRTATPLSFHFIAICKSSS